MAGCCEDYFKGGETVIGGSAALRVDLLDEDAFAALHCDWADLLAKSNADPLFMSWPWLYSWWETWGESLGLELMLLGVYQADDQLVGIAPMYRHRIPLSIGMTVTRVHFLGNAWRVSPTVRTEYVGLVARSELESDVALAVAAYLKTLTWDELVIPDSQEEGGGALGRALAEACRATPVVRSESMGVCIDTALPIEPWLAILGPNTRRKAFNRRCLFEKQLGGNWQLCENNGGSQAAFLDQLNRFHVKRWEKPCFDDKACQFHLKLLSRLSDKQRALMSRLVVNGQVVSVLYDIHAGARVYNLQSGYDENLNPKLSLGTLHLGYAIEQAFQDPEINQYDLLAGSGKNTFYKARFNGRQVSFPTVDLVRSPMLRTAYRLRSWLPGGLVSRINRVFRL